MLEGRHVRRRAILHGQTRSEHAWRMRSLSVRELLPVEGRAIALTSAVRCLEVVSVVHVIAVSGLRRLASEMLSLRSRRWS